MAQYDAVSEIVPVYHSLLVFSYVPLIESNVNETGQLMWVKLIYRSLKWAS